MKDQEKNNSNNKDQGFGLPQDYFKNSANRIAEKLAWIEEHKDFQDLTELRNHGVFSIPENYFEKNATALELISLPQLKSQKGNNPFSVPENYFNAESTEEKYPALDQLKKQSFTVPELYFSIRAEKTKTLLSEGKTGRVITLWARLGTMSAAAVLILSLGFWLYNTYFKTEPESDCGGIACIDKKDLLESKNLEGLEDEDLFELVDTKKLEQSLQQNNPPVKREKDSISEEELLDNI